MTAFLARSVLLVLSALFIPTATMAPVAAPGKAGAASGPHPPFKKLWQFSTREQMDGFFRKGNLIFYGANRAFGAMDLRTGKRVWETTAGKDSYYGTQLACDGKTLYIAVGRLALTACDANTGRQLWSMPLKEYPRPMTAHDGVLYWEQEAGVLTALDTSTRKTRWTRRIEGPAKGKRRPLEVGLSRDPIIFGERLYLGTLCGKLICLDLRSGSERWQYSPKPKEDAETSITGIALDENRVYFTTDDGEIAAVDRTSGKEKWRFKPQGWTCSGDPVILQDMVLFDAADGTLYALNAGTGKVRWTRNLSREREPDMSPVTLTGNTIWAGANSRIFAFDSSGKPLWDWDSEEDLFYYPITPLDDGILLAGANEFYRFAMGQPPALPQDPAGRLDMAKKLVSRFDELTKDEKRTLTKLGDEAFEAVLPLVQQRLQTYETLEQTGKESFDAYSKFSDAMEALESVSTPNRTPEVMELYRSAKTLDVQSKVLQCLEEKGDEKETVPLFLDIMKNSKPDPECGRDLTGLALYALAESSDPRAVDYLITQLRNQSADPTVRHEAFVTVAAKGGARGLEAVLSTRDTCRTIPSLAQIMQLDKLPKEVKPKTKDYEWPWSLPAKLVAARKDSGGTLWGLLESRAAGFADRLWLVTYGDNGWENPVFTGSTLKQIGNTDWLATLKKDKSLTRDSDGDGWTDRLELQIGTDPNKADTDGDGLEDSEDKNPLAAPRALTEEEKVLAAAFQARFQFGQGRDAVCLVGLPKGIEPFEFAGWDWVIVACKPEGKSPQQDMTGKGIGTITFHLPEYDFDGNAVHDRAEDHFILWNKDHTEAMLQLCTHYGGLDGTGFDVHLKKLEGQWVVVSMNMVWIS